MFTYSVLYHEHNTTFQVPKAFLDFGSRVVLVAKGLDTVATVSIGGSALTPAVDNMFRTWVWDVTDHVQE